MPNPIADEIRELLRKLHQPAEVNPQELEQSLKAAVGYLDTVSGVLAAIKNLHAVASESLLHDAHLDETAKGHRLGVIEVCEAVLLMQ